ncbi:hypothetical protein [Streptomyces sp. NBC_01803]|nr:hypothetical protein [Streptomyces sp. NBC_01803]WSA47405.1 hypothetical protein OIE51_26470 [Streptomyces sp. NBC_01803]
MFPERVSSTGSSLQEFPMADVVFLVVTVAEFALVAYVAQGVAKL